MPRKNIYIRKEDEHILEEAKKEIGEDKALGALLMEALEEKIKNLPETRQKALELQLLKECDIPIWNEAIEFYMQDFSDVVVLEAETKAHYAYIADPEHFNGPPYDYQLKESKFKKEDESKEKSLDLWWEIKEEFIWSGIRILLPSFYETKNDKNSLMKYWFERAKSLIEKGKKKIEKSEENNKVDLKSLNNYKSQDDTNE